jgi:signal transduction histidine kinase
MARILHIEDDPANRLLVRKLLTAAGHAVVEAIDGLAGVRAAVEQTPDLVLLDLHLPHLSGYEVALRLRSEPALGGVPIVAITAEGSRDGSLSVGCDGFLQKPLDAKRFAEQVGSYLQGRREQVPEPTRAVELHQQSQRIVARLEQKVTELSEANERLREVDSARTEFYRNVSHELATPLTPIVGYVRLLVDEELGPLSPAQKRALSSVDDSVRRLRGVIDNLLDITGLATGRLRLSRARYDVGEVARKCRDEVRARAAKATLALLDDVPAGPMLATGDAAALGRALHQLLDNALKFTPHGGAVGLRVAPTSSGYELTVADTGPGIPSEALGRAFDPFYQLDGSRTRKHGGLGAGLAIARGVARGLGGDVELVTPASERIGGRLFNGTAALLRVATTPP